MVLGNPNSTWEAQETCPANDLWYLLNEVWDILCDENWNRLLAHNWEKECKTGQTWNDIL